MLLLRNRCRMGEVMRCALSTFSNLNLSDHAMRGRQRSWSVNTMMSIIVRSPQRMAAMSPLEAAVCR